MNKQKVMEKKKLLLKIKLKEATFCLLRKMAWFTSVRKTYLMASSTYRDR